jgi:hypothetical protein
VLLIGLNGLFVQSFTVCKRFGLFTNGCILFIAEWEQPRSNSDL